MGAVSDGAAILDAVRESAPDVLVMDIIMPRKDGFMVLEELRSLDSALRPKVIVLTGLSRDDFIMRAISLGAGYYMVKPFDMHVLYSRILEIARESTAVVNVPVEAEALSGSESVEEQITNLFLTLGIPAHIKGYQYLREGVRMVLENHEVINRITKELYPGIARKFGTSASKVERAMRHAIEVAWTRDSNSSGGTLMNSDADMIRLFMNVPALETPMASTRGIFDAAVRIESRMP